MYLKKEIAIWILICIDSSPVKLFITVLIAICNPRCVGKQKSASQACQDLTKKAWLSALKIRIKEHTNLHLRRKLLLKNTNIKK
jgi:hypothetical protein